jgi:hypothetical protein
MGAHCNMFHNSLSIRIKVSWRAGQGRLGNSWLLTFSVATRKVGAYFNKREFTQA